MTSDARPMAHDWYPVALPQNVSVGDGSWVYSAYAFIHCRSLQRLAVSVGRSSGVYRGCFFELGPSGCVRIGDFTALVGVTFATNREVRIGDYCFLAHEVVIADHSAARPPADDYREDCVHEDAASVWVGDDVWIGAGAVLLSGARIGSGAVIGAGSVVDFRVPEGAVIAGNPARVVGSTGGTIGAPR